MLLLIVCATSGWFLPRAALLMARAWLNCSKIAATKFDYQERERARSSSSSSVRFDTTKEGTGMGGCGPQTFRRSDSYQVFANGGRKYGPDANYHFGRCYYFYYYLLNLQFFRVYSERGHSIALRFKWQYAHQCYDCEV